jgi:hypothetical protein
MHPAEAPTTARNYDRKDFKSLFYHFRPSGTSGQVVCAGGSGATAARGLLTSSKDTWQPPGAFYSKLSIIDSSSGYGFRAQSALVAPTEQAEVGSYPPDTKCSRSGRLMQTVLPSRPRS